MVERTEVAVASALIVAITAVVALGFGQLQRLHGAGLVGYVVVYAFYFLSAYEGTLHTRGLVAVGVEHVSKTNELVGSGPVEDDARVHHRTYLECYASGEVGLDVSGDDRRGGALRCYYHVYAHCACQLRDARYRHFHFFACCHNKVAKLVDYHHDVGHVFVAFGEVELVVDELVVIFLNVSCPGKLQHVVAVIHERAQTLKGAHHLGHVGYYGFVVGIHLSHEMVGNGRVDTEFHLFRVDEHKLKLVGMLLVEQRGDDDIQAHRLSLTGCSGHEKVRDFREVGHEHLVGNGFTEHDGQVELGVLKPLRIENALHRHVVALLVWHLDAYCSLTGNWGYDAHSECREAQCDVVFEVSDFCYAYAFGRGYLIQSYGGPDGGLYLAYLDAETFQHFYNLFVVRLYLLHVDIGFTVFVVLAQQVEGGALVFRERLTRIYRGIQVGIAGHRFSAGLFGFHTSVNGEFPVSGSIAVGAFGSRR